MQPTPIPSADPAASFSFRRIAVPAFGPSLLFGLGEGAILPIVPLMARELGRKGAGQFAVPGLIRVKKIVKPATKGGMRPNPFKPGEMMEVKPKPARNVVKAQPLKGLKDLVK